MNEVKEDQGANSPRPRSSFRGVAAAVLALAVVMTALGAGTAGAAGTKPKGKVTPLPHATPVKKEPGLTLGMIITPLNLVKVYQAGVDRHDKHYAFYTNPDLVIKNALPKYGFKPPVHLVSPTRPFPRYDSRPVRRGAVKYNNKIYSVFVAQPMRRGKTGVWVIVTILPQSLRTGQISRPIKEVQRIQSHADKKEKTYLLWLNPNKVVLKELPQYGFVPPIKIMQNAKPVRSATGRPLDLVVVLYQKVTYDVYVAQPLRRGKTGVWVVVTIYPA